MVVRLVRDHFTNDTSEVIVDNKESFTALKSFMKLILPRMQNRIKLYQDTRPLFSRNKVEEQIESLYQRTVKLPSGGSIVFDSGEAMVSIDVNSGKTTGASQLEETALNTNLEAAQEIGRQLRLRDLGGLIVIDFIDMFQKKNQSLVEKELKKICKLDKARINISRISKFGLMEMSRQRLSPPVQEGAFIKCEACNGTGTVRALNYIVLDVMRKIRERLATGKVKELKVEVSPPVTEYLLNNKAKFLLELQERHQFKLEFIGQPGLAWAEFKYQVTEKTAEELARQESRIKGASSGQRDDRKKPEEDSGEKRSSSGRVARGGRGRPTQRKHSTRKPSSGRRVPAQRGRGRRPVKTEKKSTDTPTSQSKIIEKTIERATKADDATSMTASNRLVPPGSVAAPSLPSLGGSNSDISDHVSEKPQSSRGTDS
jgi:ribonuclease E